MKLKGNPNWNGGKSFEPYPDSWNKKFKTVIRQRDYFQCAFCGPVEIKLHVHHIDHEKQNNDPENLITLCVSCHIGPAHRKKRTLEEEDDFRQFLIDCAIENEKTFNKKHKKKLREKLSEC